MDVVALLPRQLLLTLRSVLGSKHSIAVAQQWADVVDAVRTGSADLVVADPTAVGPSGAGGVETLDEVCRRYPSVPVVVYTQLGPASVQAVVRLAKVGVEHVVLSRFDDEPRAFRDLLESIPARGLGDRMLKELAPELTRLPPEAARAVEQLFRSPASFKNARDLAGAAGMNLRTLYRTLEGAGIYSARSLAVAARLVRAFTYLQDPSRSIKEVAAKAGYHSAWQLTQHMRELTGVTTEEARRAMSRDDIVVRIAEQLRRRRRKQ